MDGHHGGAISSSLSHPNNVQTYTYSMRPIYDSSGNPSDGVGLGSSGGDEGAARNAAEGTPPSSGRGGSPDFTPMVSFDGDNKGLLGFEVQIVMELMELGSLRKLLDQGTFRWTVCGNGVEQYDIDTVALKPSNLHLPSTQPPPTLNLHQPSTSTNPGVVP